VEQEGAVRDVLDLDTVKRSDGRADPFDVGRRLGEDGYVPHFRATLDADQVNRVKQSLRFPDRLRHDRK